MRVHYFLWAILIFFCQIAMAQPQAEKPPVFNVDYYTYYYEISKASHLLWIAIGDESEEGGDERLTKTYQLMSDIDASETKDWYEGKGFPMIKGFRGNIEGQFFKIKDLYINRPDEDSVGFISYGGRTIKNLIFENVEVIGADYTGAIIGRSWDVTPDLNNVVVSGSVKGKKYVGGHIGQMNAQGSYSSFSGLFNLADVEGDSLTGGLIGKSTGDDMYISLSQNYGSISADQWLGGFIGKSENSLNYIQLSSNLGMLTANKNVGVLVGQSVLNRYLANYANKDQLPPNVNTQGCTLLDREQFSSAENFNESFRKSHNFREYPDFKQNGIIPVPKAFSQPFRFTVKNGESWMPNNLVNMCLFSEGIEQGYGFDETAKISLQLGAGTKFSHIRVDGVDYFDNPCVIPIKQGMANELEIWLEEDYSFEGGDGSREQPFQIGTFEQFEQLAYNLNLKNKHFELVNDIDASITRTRPDGAKFTSILDLGGVFNGNGYSIANLDVFDTHTAFYANYGEIINLRLENCSLLNPTYSGSPEGLLVERNYGTINNCHIKGEIISESSDQRTKRGMIAGYNAGIITESSAIGSVETNSDFGGLVGSNGVEGIIFNCFSNVQAATHYAGIGGLVSENSGHISLSYSMGTYHTTSSYQSYGGVVYKENGTGTNSGVGLYFDLDILDPSAYTIIDAEEYGISTDAFANEDRFPYFDFDKVWEIRQIDEIDEHPRPYLKSMIYDKVLNISVFPVEAEKSLSGDQAYYIGDTAKLSVRGHKGYRFSHWQAGKDTLSTDPNYNFKVMADTPYQLSAHFIWDKSQLDIKGTGSSMDPYQITKLEHLEIISHTSKLNAKSFILMNDIDASETAHWNEGKGFRPINLSGQFNGQGYKISNLYINRSFEEKIGFFGHLTGRVFNLHFRDATVVGRTNVGILAGNAHDNQVVACSATGKVHGNYRVGGLIGRLQDFDILHCYTKVNVSGASATGGLLGVGFNYSTIAYNYSASTQIGEGEYDPFSWSPPIFTTPEHNYFDKDVANSETAKGAEPLTTQAFKDINSFKGDHWNFDASWQIENEVNDPFYLRPVHQWNTPIQITSELLNGVEQIPAVGKYVPGIDLDYDIITGEGARFLSLLINDTQRDQSGTLDMTKNQHFEISANRHQYKVNIQIEGHGKVEPFIQGALYGDNHEFTFTPVKGGALLEVFINDESIGNPSTYTLENITADVKVKAVFSRVLANDISSGLKVYPVPASHKLFVEGLGTDRSVQILGLDGRIIQSVELRDNHAWIEIGSLSSGMYLLKTASATIRFVKQ
ncbi:T9SS type A sorting domain-containing protein [Persicobacter psychrovividus]|uniref:T9SS type A sorting domain-containing protein n=1 Tax=Persicobacter psychrovividus TaxID=387638 RepID=A0ABM7VID0_9BACT|nr:hypothetical protein PEPS_30160 [Persicobacter psychrovividus]